MTNKQLMNLNLNSTRDLLSVTSKRNGLIKLRKGLVMSEADRFVQWVADCWLAGFSLIEILDSVSAEYGGLIPYSTTADLNSYKHCALETFDFLETQAESRKCTM